MPTIDFYLPKTVSELISKLDICHSKYFHGFALPFGSSEPEMLLSLLSEVLPTKGQSEYRPGGRGCRGGWRKEHLISTLRFDVHYVWQDPGGKDAAS